MVHQLIPSLMPPAVFTSFIGDAGDIVILILPVLGSMLLFYGIFQVIIESKTSNRKKVQDRLHGKRTKQEKIEHSIIRRGALGDSKSFADAVLGKFKFVPKIQTMLNQADLDWSASTVLLNLSGAALLAVVGLVLVKVHVVAAIACGAVIIVLPLFWLGLRRRRRISKITNQLPDVFDMMGQALRAGHSLAGAVQLIYEQMPPPIATEFAQVYHEQNLGMRIEDALKSMADRVDSLDVRFFVTAVMIQRQTGGDLAEV
ncbi:MAG: type II secretion system F family protein, partial [Planctomycetes bacterium]|nr:type II secretion system F family protein [Planctomycetota bacterium]